MFKDKNADRNEVRSLVFWHLRWTCRKFQYALKYAITRNQNEIFSQMKNSHTNFKQSRKIWLRFLSQVQ